MFESRRRALMDRMEDAVAVFFAAPETIRNQDVHHEYRQESDFYYLLGFEEAQAVLVVAPHKPEGERVALFLRKRDPEHEVWDGELMGTDRAIEQLKVDHAHPIDELAEKLPGYFEGVGRIYFSLGRSRADDETVLRAMRASRKARKKGIRTPQDLLDPSPALHELRLVKGAEDLAAMRAAAALNARGHRRAMAATRPGMYEYQLQAQLEYAWKMGGSPRAAYPSIVGSGHNACVLHYRANTRKMEAGDLVLVDAGCELHYYASDVTRTWPVSGRFTRPQRAVYEVVLAAQKAAIDRCRPGETFNSVHDAALRVLVEGMLELGLIEGTVDECIEQEKYKKYYMHRTSHWIGMDVHDVGDYYVDGASRKLEPGMALTVEPGLYINDPEAPAELRGIGVRIEDDVVVTTGEPEVLTADIPKEVAELEALVGTAPATEA